MAMEEFQQLKHREDEAHDLFVMTSNLLEREIERRGTLTLNHEEVTALLHCVGVALHHIPTDYLAGLTLTGPVNQLLTLQELFKDKGRK